MKIVISGLLALLAPSAFAFVDGTFKCNASHNPDHATEITIKTVAIAPGVSLPYMEETYLGQTTSGIAIVQKEGQEETLRIHPQLAPAISWNSGRLSSTCSQIR